jgi:hypothetical protein
VVLLNPVDQLGQVVPNGSQRLGGHGHRLWGIPMPCFKGIRWRPLATFCGRS